jgi:hypothetical protein
VRIAEGHDAIADDQRHHGIAATAAPMHGGHGGEDCPRRQLVCRLLLELVGEHVQQGFGVRAGVQVAPVLLDQQGFQLIGVGQVAVMRQRDAVWRIDVKGLGFT